MNKGDLIRNLKHTEKKHRKDTVNTFDTDISMMCSDVLRVLKNCIEIPEGATTGDMIKAMLNNSVYELELAEIETVYCEKVVKVIGRSKEKDPNIIGGKNKPLFNCIFKAELWNSPFKKGAEE